jgi:hypothetical protein
MGLIEQASVQDRGEGEFIGAILLPHFWLEIPMCKILHF